MDREQEEAVQRITARYVEEMRAGQQPRLSDYLVRYPQYANAIVEFVTYYHAIEADVSDSSTEYVAASLPQLTEDFFTAIEYAKKRLAAMPTIGPNTTLLGSLNRERVPLRQVATAVGLSKDIVTKLDQRKIDARTIPGELFRLLATALRQPVSTIQAYFGLVPQQQVAEAPIVYQVEQSLQGQLQSLREAIEQSKQLSDQQKFAWRSLLDEEQL